MKFKNILITFILATFLLSTCASVYAQVPQIPAAYYGTVKLITPDGLADASAGAVIKAYVGAVECGSITTTEPGNYGGPGGADPKLVVQGDIQSGKDNVTFYVNGIMAEENVTWVSGDVKQVNLTAYPVPVANFTATPTVGKYPLTVQFNDTTLVAPETWLWSFGDGTNSTVRNSTHTYESEGAYTVSLTVTKGLATDTETKPRLIIVTAVQPAHVTEAKIVGAQQNYVVEVPQSNTTVTVNTTGDVDVTVVTYAENPHPAVPLPQDVAVVPKYIDIIVSEPDAVVWPIYVKMSYTTADLAGINENQLVGLYYWDSGAGMWRKCSDTGVNTTDFNGYSGYLWARMNRSEVSGAPIIPGADTTPPVAVISATPTSGTSPLTVSFNGGSSTDNIGIVSHSWSFGDGTTGTGITTTHAYAAGTYTATLTVRDAAGNTGINSLTVTVSVAPVVTPPVVTVPARFELSSLQVSPTTVTAGNGVTISARISNVGGLEGDYTVTLSVNGTFEASQTVRLIAGGSTTVSFTVVKDAEGTYAVEIDGLTSTFTVTLPAPPPTPLNGTQASIVFTIVANVPQTIDVASYAPSSSLRTIVIITNDSFPSVQLSTAEYSENPTSTPLPSTVTSISYLKIELNIPSGSVSQATIRFRVAKSTLASLGLDPATVQLHRLTSTWGALSTAMTGQDADYYYFESVSPGFSYFAITATSLVADTVPPTILSVSPADNATVTTARPTITVQYSDDVAVDPTSVRLLLDNVDVTSLSAVNATVTSYTPSVALAEGRHDLYFEVKDTSGNKAFMNWSFTISIPDTTPPVISALTPADGSTLTSTAVTVSASYSDNVAVNVSSVVLTVDGTPVAPTVTATGVSYSTTLEEGTHTVQLTVRDTAGNAATSMWSFTVRLPTPPNYTVYIIAAIAVIIVIAAIAILMRRKR